jgi:hypothetical protein
MAGAIPDDHDLPFAIRADGRFVPRRTTGGWRRSSARRWCWSAGPLMFSPGDHDPGALVVSLAESDPGQPLAEGSGPCRS